MAGSSTGRTPDFGSGGSRFEPGRPAAIATPSQRPRGRRSGCAACPGARCCTPQASATKSCSTPATGFVERAERLVRRASVVGAEGSTQSWPSVAEDELRGRSAASRLGAEELGEPALGAPLERRAHAGRRRHVAADVLNIWPMKPSGVQLASPIRPPGRQTRSQLGRGARLVGREHHAERRQHGVERAVGERQRLGVGLAERRSCRPSAAARRAARRAARARSRWRSRRRRGGPRRAWRCRCRRRRRAPARRRRVDGLAQRLADDLQRVVPITA